MYYQYLRFKKGKLHEEGWSQPALGEFDKNSRRRRQLATVCYHCKIHNLIKKYRKQQDGNV